MMSTTPTNQQTYIPRLRPNSSGSGLSFARGSTQQQQYRQQQQHQQQRQSSEIRLVTKPVKEEPHFVIPKQLFQNKLNLLVLTVFATIAVLITVTMIHTDYILLTLLVLTGMTIAGQLLISKLVLRTWYETQKDPRYREYVQKRRAKYYDELSTWNFVQRALHPASAGEDEKKKNVAADVSGGLSKKGGGSGSISSNNNNSRVLTNPQQKEITTSPWTGPSSPQNKPPLGGIFTKSHDTTTTVTRGIISHGATPMTFDRQQVPSTTLDVNHLPADTSDHPLALNKGNNNNSPPFKTRTPPQENVVPTTPLLTPCEE